MLFLSNVILSNAPTSFVREAFKTSSFIIGSSSSVPISDQVPELINIKSSSLVGIAVIADAVSCDGTQITGMS